MNTSQMVQSALAQNTAAIKKQIAKLEGEIEYYNSLMTREEYLDPDKRCPLQLEVNRRITRILHLIQGEK